MPEPRPDAPIEPPDARLNETAPGNPRAVLVQQRRAEERQLAAQMELARQLEEAAEARRTLQCLIESQRRAEAELRASESRYRSIFDLAPDSMFLISADPADAGRILEANERAAAAHGYTRAELLGMKIGDLDMPDDAQKVPERIARMMAGETIVFEVSHLRKDGTDFPVEVTARVVEFDGRKRILAFNRDISERRRMRAIEAREERRFRDRKSVV